MTTRSSRLIDKVWELFFEYQDEVLVSKLSPTSKEDYLLFVHQFVRWIDGDFTPGGTLE